MDHNVISMDAPKEKLAKLEDHMPDSKNKLVYDFGRYLAGQFKSQILPEGFVLGCELALYDLQAGVDGFTGKPIQSKLVGYPPMIYAFLRTEIPSIATAIFPPDFAEDIKNFIDEC